MSNETSPFAEFAGSAARPPVRDQMGMTRSGPPGGEEDHLERARRRLAELRALPEEPESTADKLYAAAPPGWSYNWKAAAIYNKEDLAYIAGVQRGGWSFVPASRHMNLLYPGYRGETIIIGGLVLMERPLEWTRRAEARELQAARDVIRTKSEQLRQAPEGTAPRDHPEVRPRINISVGPVEIPSD